MEKNIKDYLHLYLGCEVVREGEGKVLLDTDNLDYIRQYNIYNEIKPILRPLSDMTEEERNEYCHLIDMELEDWTCLLESAIIQIGKGTVYLLSKHFDLFNLIEEGLALDATKEAVK